MSIPFLSKNVIMLILCFYVENVSKKETALMYKTNLQVSFNRKQSFFRKYQNAITPIFINPSFVFYRHNTTICRLFITSSAFSPMPSSFEAVALLSTIMSISGCAVFASIAFEITQMFDTTPQSSTLL